VSLESLANLGELVSALAVVEERLGTGPSEARERSPSRRPRSGCRNPAASIVFG
jgi:hypothetical protein